MFIDGDDYIHREMVSTLHNAITAGGGGKIAMCGFKRTNSLKEDTQRPVRVEDVSVLNRDEIVKLLFKRQCDFPYIVLWNKLFRHTLIDGESFGEYLISEDLDFMFRIFMKCNQITYAETELYYYVMRESSTVHRTEAWTCHYRAITAIRHQNYLDMSSQMQHRYGHYVLKDLYRKMAEYKYITRGTSEYDNACQQCRQYIRDTRKAYWSNRRISIFEKILSTMQLQFPFIVKWLTALRRIVRPQLKMPRPVTG